jgi:hypothetical protein
MRLFQLSLLVLAFIAGGLSSDAFAQTSGAPTQASATTGSGKLIARGEVPLQGSCDVNKLAADAHKGNDANFSTWSCTGLSDTPLNFDFDNKESESCLYIDNISDEEIAYFVPMRTYVEWLAFKTATKANGSLVNKVAITYGCNADVVQKDSCGEGANLPSARHGAYHTVFSPSPSTLKTTFYCEALNGCGTWVKTNETGTCKVNGTCGASNGLTLSEEPASGLCDKGTPSAISGSGPWTWTCAGSQGGSTASCSAQTTPCAGTKPVNLVIVLDASGSMQTLVDAAKDAIKKIATTYLADKPNVTVTLTVFGGVGYTPDPAYSSGMCDVGKLVGPSGLDSPGIIAALNSVEAVNNTPLARALQHADQYIDGKPNPAVIVLTDGHETCGGNVNDAAAALNTKGVKLFGIAYPSPSYGTYNASSFSKFDSYATAGTDQEVLDVLNTYLTQSICQQPGSNNR